MKIIKIEDCTQCKYDEIVTQTYGNFKRTHTCFKDCDYKEIENYPKIPVWCPLEDDRDIYDEMADAAAEDYHNDK